MFVYSHLFCVPYSYIHNDLEVALVGTKVDLTYEYNVCQHLYWSFSLLYCYALQHLGEGGQILEDIATGKHPFSKQFAAAKRPMIVVGSVALQRPDGAAIHRLASRIATSSESAGGDWRVMNVLHRVCYQILCVFLHHTI